MSVVGIVGLGVVGGTVARAMADAGVTTRGYDPYQGVGEPADLAGCAVVFVCVPTPSAVDGSHDLSELWAAMNEIEPHLDAGIAVVVKSTVPPGTCDSLAAAFPRVELVSVPEFLVATQRMETFTRPDRIVIGARSHDAAAAVAELMSRVAPAAPVVVMLRTEAELVKLCSNAMLAAKVSMANELARLCDGYDVAWPRVQAVVGMDRRIGPEHLTVTLEGGFGGECLPKDLDGLIVAARAVGYEAPFLRQLAAFNRAIRGNAAGDGRSQAPVGSASNKPNVAEVSLD